MSVLRPGQLITVVPGAVLWSNETMLPADYVTQVQRPTLCLVISCQDITGDHPFILFGDQLLWVRCFGVREAWALERSHDLTVVGSK